MGEQPGPEEARRDKSGKCWVTHRGSQWVTHRVTNWVTHRSPSWNWTCLRCKQSSGPEEEKRDESENLRPETWNRSRAVEFSTVAQFASRRPEAAGDCEQPEQPVEPEQEGAGGQVAAAGLDSPAESAAWDNFSGLRSRTQKVFLHEGLH